MMKPRWFGTRTIALAACVAGLWLARPVPAADLDKADPALKWVPADVSFYSSSLHGREQLEAMRKSRAWAKLWTLPLVQQGWKQLTDELNKPEGPMQQFQAFRKAPENQRLLELLGELFSEEWLVYGGGNFSTFLEAITEISASMQLPAQLQLTGQAGGVDPAQLLMKALLNSVAKRPELIQIPEVMIGFKLTKVELAREQQKRLADLLQAALKQNPDAKLQVKTSKVGDSDFLVLTLPFKDLKVSLEAFEKKPGEYERIVEQINKQTLTLALGVRDQYLLLSVGSSLAPVERLGQGGPSLATVPEMQKLAPFADRTILDIGYVSKPLITAALASQNWMANLARQGQDFLKNAENLPEELRSRMKKDLSRLAQEAKERAPVPGAMVSFTFQTPRGQESYTYNWTQYKDTDGSKPLTILNQLGGSPILAYATRSKYDPKNYEMLVKWLKTGVSYVEDFALPALGDDAKKQYEQVMQIAQPILKQLDEATGKMLLPAMKDGQTAFVFDAKLTSKRWFEGMPAADQPLPLPELAVVFGVSDQALLKKAFEGYRDAINNTLDAVSNASGGLFPNLKVPDPETKKLKSGMLYYYSIPPFLGIDTQFQPNAGLSSGFLVLSLSLEHSERLLTKTPLKTDLTVMKDLERPRASAFYCNWPALLKGLSPWIDYGVKQAIATRGEDAKAAEEILKQVHTLLEILAVLRDAGSVTYVEDKVTITHGEMVFKDIK
jgi:hypothetical protein